MAAASTPAARRALRPYAEPRSSGLGDGAPWQAGERMARWQDGTAVDMVSG